jgi:hypothetical protein
VIWNYLRRVVVAVSEIGTRRFDAPFLCVREAANGTGMLLLTVVVSRRTAAALYVDERTVTRMTNFETV